MLVNYAIERDSEWVELQMQHVETVARRHVHFNITQQHTLIEEGHKGERKEREGGREGGREGRREGTDQTRADRPTSPPSPTLTS